MPQWMPKTNTLENDIADEEARILSLKARREPVWEPPVQEMGTFVPNLGIVDYAQPELPIAEPIQPIRYSDFNFSQETPQWQPPQAQYSLPQLVSPTAETAPFIETPAPKIEQPKKVEDYSKELDALHPFKIDETLPLWAKTLSAIGKPFEIVQEYLFDPVLGVIHQPWAQKAMTPAELRQANQEGIASYFPGGLRHKAYEQLQYTGKFVTELLPWLIVPPIGAVGVAGKAGTGIAGALSKLGKVGQIAGRTLEYSPAGLSEKAVGAAIGKVAGKTATKTTPMTRKEYIKFGPQGIPLAGRTAESLTLLADTKKNPGKYLFHATPSADDAISIEQYGLTSGGLSGIPESGYAQSPEGYILIFKRSDIAKGVDTADVSLIQGYKPIKPIGVFQQKEYGGHIEYNARMQELGDLPENPSDIHYEEVKQALIKGKTVPQSVLEDYPDLLKYVPTPGASPEVSELVKVIRSAQTKLPEQKILNKELRARQAQKANEALANGGYGESGLRAFMGALKGEGEKVDFENIAQKLTSAQKNKYAEMIRASDKITIFQKAQAASGWKKVLDGKLPVDSELDQLEKIFGSDVIQALTDKKPGNIINTISDVANAPRAVLSAVDFSGLLRQGAILTARYPVSALKSFKPMVRSFFKDSNAQLVDDVIRARPHTDILEQAGMYLAPLPGKRSPLSRMEESFMSKWVERLPIIGAVVKASNRAYVTGLNDLRSRVGENILNSWEKMGVKVTDVDYKALGKLINSASGRGSLYKALQGASPLLNAMMFSPRLFFSRLEFPRMLASESPLVRKEAARMLVQFLGAGTSILGMAHVMGAKVELDPRSADFAKMKIGNTRLDIWSGYAQWARFLAQLTTEQRKTSGGNIVEANRYDVAERFIQSKNSPAAGLLFDILRGESYAGEEVDLQGKNIQRQAYTRLMPLFLQDMIDAIDQEGLAGGMVALPGLFGVGVVTYMSPAQKIRENLAQTKYGVSWEQLGKTKGLAAQLDLERSSPELLALVQKENEEYDKSIMGKSDIGNIYRNQTETIEREYRSIINLATQEYRDTGDGYTYKEKILEAASNRRSQYDILNKDPQFATIVARYNELPTVSDLQKMSPQDWARKEYMRMMYSKDMYDQYGNYRFDMLDDVKTLFVQTFGREMLDYVETYQGVKDSDMPPEYLEWKQAQKTLKLYWAVADQVAKLYGQTFAESKRGQSFISKQRKRMRQTNPDIAQAYEMFYAQT